VAQTPEADAAHAAATHGAEAATAAAGAAEHASGGLPQFDLAQWPGQMVWMLIIFGILYFLFSKVFVPKVGGAIAAREDRISGDIGAARRMKEESEAQAAAVAEEMNQARGRAHKLAQDAKSKAKSDAALRQAEEETKLAKSLASAEARIGAARDQALVHVQAIAETTAEAMVAKLTGKAATAAELKAAKA
jgi:F-type H+-transporting ATPase subunit b